MNADLRRGAVGACLVALGAIAVLAGWLGLRGADYIAEQIAFATSGGLIGLVLVVVGVGAIGSSNSRMQLERLRRIEDAVRSRGDADE